MDFFRVELPNFLRKQPKKSCSSGFEKGRQRKYWWDSLDQSILGGGFEYFILWDLSEVIGVYYASMYGPFRMVGPCASTVCILRVRHGKKGCSELLYKQIGAFFPLKKRRVSRKRIWIFPAALTNSHSRVDITPNNFNTFTKQRNKIRTTLVLPFYQRASCIIYIIEIRWIHLQPPKFKLTIFCWRNYLFQVVICGTLDNQC